MIEHCKECKGVIYPFIREVEGMCVCVSSDYEQCAQCGFDHEYEEASASMYCHSME